MSLKYHSKVPKNAKIYIGERGGLYYMRNGKRVYLHDKDETKKRTYKPPVRGAYARYLANQLSNIWPPAPPEGHQDYLYTFK